MWKLYSSIFILVQIYSKVSSDDVFSENNGASTEGNLNNALFCEDIEVGNVFYTLKTEVDDPTSIASYTVGGTLAEYVLASNNGELKLVQKFRYEERKNIDYTLTANKKDGTQFTYPESSTGKPLVFINDANNNPPSVSLITYVDIYEHPWTPDNFGTFDVTDLDTIEKDSYSFTQTTDEYEIYQTSPTEVQLIKNDMVQLDYETTPTIVSEIKLQDIKESECGGPATFEVTIPVNFQVRDGPDSPPVFTKLPGIINIDENQAIGEEIGQVQARDQDYKLDWDIVYEIVSTEPIITETFEVTNDGIIQLKKLIDRESLTSSDQLQFQIKATEVVPDPDPFESKKGEVGYPFSVEVTVTVNVQDVDDNDPIFYKLQTAGDVGSKQPETSFSSELPEDTSIGSTVQGLDIYVEDLDQGSNAAFSIKIDDETVPFTLSVSEVFGASTVDLRVNKELDFEDGGPTTYSFKLQAVDPTDVVLTEATVELILTDVNDENPVFIAVPEDCQVLENSGANTEVCEVEASDDDSSAELEYKISNTVCLNENGIEIDTSECENWFVVSLKDGKITVNSADVDRETVETVVLTIEAEDTAADPSFVQKVADELRITILDENDNSPNFQDDNNIYQVDENSLDTIVGQVTSTDVDKDNNGEILYSVGGEWKDYFVVDEKTGEFRTSTTNGLDRETIGSSIDVTIVATDMGTPPQSGEIIVEVKIRDTNDNSPIIENLDGSITVAENTKDVADLFQVIATDEDEDRNSQLTYVIQESGVPFSIDPDTGSISIVPSADLDYETKTQYQLTIRVQDNGISVRYSDPKTLTIDITDENDNPPLFSQKNQFLSVPEGSPGSTGVFIGLATDADSNDKETNYYFVVGGSGTQKFDIEKETGEIRRKEEVDRETVDKFDLVIKVTEEDTTPTELELLCEDVVESNSYACINITVTDVNDCSPVFSENPFLTDVSLEIQTSEDIPISFVTATDDDLAPNNVLQYSITSQQDCCGTCEAIDEKFVITDPSRGDIYLVKEIDIENGCSFKIGLKVTDGDPSHFDESELIIGVIKNDQTVKLLSAYPRLDFPKKEFENDLGNILKATVIVDSIITFELEGNALINSEVTFHAKETGSNVLIPVDEINSVLDSNTKEVTDFIIKYGIQFQSAPVVVSNDKTAQIITIVVIAVLALLCISLLISVICMKRRMNRNKRVERAMEETMDVTKRRHLSVVGGINTNYKTNENPLFNTLDEGAVVTLNIDDVYDSSHDDFDDLDNNSIKLDAEKQEKKTSQTESYAEDFNIDYNFGGESNNANLAAAFSNAIDENGEVNFDDTEF